MLSVRVVWDAGFVFGFSMPKSDPDLDPLQVTIHHLVLAAPKGHPLTRMRKLSLRDLSDTDFVWFPRRQSPPTMIAFCRNASALV